jgi:hypothetical protein
MFTAWTDIDWLPEGHRWPDLAAFGKVIRVRETATKTTSETIDSLFNTALSGERFNERSRP